MAEPKQDIALREATTSAVAQLQDAEFAVAVADATPEGVSARQILRAAATAVLENPKLANPALRATLLRETLKVAADGLRPDGREAAFVIYKVRGIEEVKCLVMIGGLRIVAADHGWNLDTKIVYENDQYDPDFDTGRANHKPARLGTDRGEIIGAYASAVHRDGRRMLEQMNVADVERVRAKSRAKDGAGVPWVEWWDRMAEKTVGKRLFKKLGLDPKDRRIASVLQALDEESPADALYGPAEAQSDLEHGGREGAPNAAAAPSPDPSDGDEPDIIEGDADDPDEWVPDEPSDEELAALGAGDVTAVDELHFPAGKFKDKTFAEVYADGQTGIGYLKWAVRDWQEGEFKDALRAFAAGHPELNENEAT